MELPKGQEWREAAVGPLTEPVKKKKKKQVATTCKKKM